MNEWCHFTGGPIDGDCFPLAPHAHTARMVIYQSGAEPGKAGRELDYPAVYTRDDRDVRQHRWTGMDGIERTGPSQGYAFECYRSKRKAAQIERERQAEMDAEGAEGESL